MVLVLPYYETGGIDKHEIIEERMGVSEPYLVTGVTCGHVICAHASGLLSLHSQ